MYSLLSYSVYNNRNCYIKLGLLENRVKMKRFLTAL